MSGFVAARYEPPRWLLRCLAAGVFTVSSQEELVELLAFLLFFGGSKEGVTALRIFNCEISADIAAAFAACPYLPNLKVLELNGCDMSTEALEILLSWRALEGLKDLSLSACSLGPDDIVAVARCTFLRYLRALDLSGNRVGGVGAEALGASPHLLALEELTLSAAGLDDNEVRLLANGGGLRSVHRLSIELNPRLTEAGARAIASSEGFGGLGKIHLDGAVVNDDVSSAFGARGVDLAALF